MSPTPEIPTLAHVLKAIGLHAFADARDWAAALNELADYSDTEISYLAGLVSVPVLKQASRGLEPERQGVPFGSP
jgi:hypothetical protein